MPNPKPYNDSLTQLLLLGLREISGSQSLGNREWRVDRIEDVDYPWMITRMADGAVRRCSSLIECVQIVKQPERAWGFQLPAGGAS
jgi:hypothetical protein